MITLHMTLVRGQLDRLRIDAPARIEKALGETAEGGANYIVKHFSTHVPSSPGNPPAVRTGQLRDSITYGRVAALLWAVYAGDSKAYYAPFLEYGTRKMAARPFMRPAAFWLEKHAVEYFKRAI